MPEALTEDMIRIVHDSIGSNGRAVRDRNLVVFVGHHALKDKRGNQRRFARRGRAMSAARAFIAEHNQLATPAPRWTREGRTLSYDGVPALEILRPGYGPHNAILLPPTTCDSIVDHICSVLNVIDIDALARRWKP